MLKAVLKKRNFNFRLTFVVVIIFIINPFIKVKAQINKLMVAVDYFHVGNLTQLSIGGALHVPVGERFTLNYQTTLGIKPGGGVYVHSHAGGYCAAFIVGNFYDHPNLEWVGILLAFVPEGVGFYPDKNKKYHIAVNPLGIDYWHQKEPFEETTKLTGTITIHRKFAAGAKFPAYILPYFAAAMIYKSDQYYNKYAFRAGILLGINDGPE